MKAAGYQVLKGRGISFIHDKKVKIKGSEVSFSWQKIERILNLKEQVQKNKVDQRFTDQDLINKQVGSSTNFNFSSGNTTYKNDDHRSAIHLQKQIHDLIYRVMKPEANHDTMPSELFKNQKLKKRRKLHL